MRLIRHAKSNSGGVPQWAQNGFCETGLFYIEINSVDTGIFPEAPAELIPVQIAAIPETGVPRFWKQRLRSAHTETIPRIAWEQ